MITRWPACAWLIDYMLWCTITLQWRTQQQQHWMKSLTLYLIACWLVQSSLSATQLQLNLMQIGRMVHINIAYAAYVWLYSMDSNRASLSIWPAQKKNNCTHFAFNIPSESSLIFIKVVITSIWNSTNVFFMHSHLSTYSLSLSCSLSARNWYKILQAKNKTQTNGWKYELKIKLKKFSQNKLKWNMKMSKENKTASNKWQYNKQ